MEVTAVIVVDSPSGPSGAARGGSGVTALEHVANRPILHHALDGLSAAGVANLIVAGEADALIDIRACMRDYAGDSADVSYVICRDGTGLTSTAQAISPLVGDSACLVQPADGLLSTPIPRVADVLEAEQSDLILFSLRSDHDDDDELVIGPGPAPIDTITRAGSVVELGLFAPGMVQRLAAITGGAAPVDLRMACRRLCAEGASVRIQPIDGWYRYRGGRMELLELNRIALDRIACEPPRHLMRTNRLEGRILVAPTAHVSDSVIIGPTVIGAGAVIREAYIGPYTSVGAGARIEGAEIERSIVAAGASVTHVGNRLVASLVGRDARVFRDFSLPRALRLWVGDGDEVGLC